MKKLLLIILLLLLCSFSGKYAFQGDYKCETVAKSDFFGENRSKGKWINIHLNYYDKEGVLVIDTSAISLTNCELVREVDNRKVYYFDGVRNKNKMKVSLVYIDRKLDTININVEDGYSVYAFWIVQENLL